VFLENWREVNDL